MDSKLNFHAAIFAELRNHNEIIPNPKGTTNRDEFSCPCVSRLSHLLIAVNFSLCSGYVIVCRTKEFLFSCSKAEHLQYPAAFNKICFSVSLSCNFLDRVSHIASKGKVAVNY